MCDYLKLVQSLNIVHQEGGGAFEAMDLPPESRHLDLYLAQSTLLDKNAQAYALGRTRTLDCIEMTCIAQGLNRSEIDKKHYRANKGDHRRSLHWNDVRHGGPRKYSRQAQPSYNRRCRTSFWQCL